jgi:hypothetical protein
LSWGGEWLPLASDGVGFASDDESPVGRASIAQFGSDVSEWARILTRLRDGGRTLFHIKLAILRMDAAESGDDVASGATSG